MRQMPDVTLGTSEGFTKAQLLEQRVELESRWGKKTPSLPGGGGHVFEVNRKCLGPSQTPCVITVQTAVRKSLSPITVASRGPE